MKIVQCWDDGVSTDIRLCELLREHQSKASFNLNAGLHGDQRRVVFEFEGTEIARLARHELRDVYEGFTIANHTLTHPFLTELADHQIKAEIADGRRQLQDLFGQPVVGFAYPFGEWNEAAIDAIGESGHLYARTIANRASCYPPTHAFEFHPTCHFRDEAFWQHYERAKRCGVFYFWGHSYEMTTEERWSAFEQKLHRIASDSDNEWAEIPELWAAE